MSTTFVNVQDPIWAGGAKGDGVANDTAAIQAAIGSGQAVYFPRTNAFYKTMSAIACSGQTRLYGDNSQSSIIRNTAGGTVLTFPAGSGVGLIEHLRIGGQGAVGVTVAGGGNTGYVTNLMLRDVNFESDLLTCIDANLIYFSAEDCTFGYFTQTATHASHKHLKVASAGMLFTTLNSFHRCKFFNAAQGQVSVDIRGGSLWRFTDCDWTVNHKNMVTDNINGLVLDNCYTEQCAAPAFQGAFQFGPTRTTVHVKGGIFNGGKLAANAAMFSYGGSTVPLLLENCDISTTADSFTVYDNSGVNNNYPNQLLRIKDCRVQGNAADPVVKGSMDGTIDSRATTAFSPVPTGLTTVVDGGTITYSGSRTLIGDTVFFTLKITCTGNCTTASTFGTSTFNLPLNFVPRFDGLCPVLNTATGLSPGIARAATSGKLILPAWPAQKGTIVISGHYPV